MDLLYRAMTDPFVNVLVLSVSISYSTCKFQKMSKTPKSAWSCGCQVGESSFSLPCVFYLWSREATQEVKFLRSFFPSLSKQGKDKCYTEQAQRRSEIWGVFYLEAIWLSKSALLVLKADITSFYYLGQLIFTVTSWRNLFLKLQDPFSRCWYGKIIALLHELHYLTWVGKSDPSLRSALLCAACKRFLLTAIAGKVLCKVKGKSISSTGMASHLSFPTSAIRNAVRNLQNCQFWNEMFFSKSLIWLLKLTFFFPPVKLSEIKKVHIKKRTCLCRNPNNSQLHLKERVTPSHYRSYLLLC